MGGINRLSQQRNFPTGYFDILLMSLKQRIFYRLVMPSPFRDIPFKVILKGNLILNQYAKASGKEVDRPSITINGETVIF